MGHRDGLRKRQGIKQKKARKRGVFLHSGFINVLISEITYQTYTEIMESQIEHISKKYIKQMFE